MVRYFRSSPMGLGWRAAVQEGFRLNACVISCHVMSSLEEKKAPTKIGRRDIKIYLILRPLPSI